MDLTVIKPHDFRKLRCHALEPKCPRHAVLLQVNRLNKKSCSGYFFRLSTFFISNVFHHFLPKHEWVQRKASSVVLVHRSKLNEKESVQEPKHVLKAIPHKRTDTQSPTPNIWIRRKLMLVMVNYRPINTGQPRHFILIVTPTLGNMGRNLES